MDNSESKNNGDLREETRKIAKKFKSAWIDLGQVLHSVYKDKLYREWGFEKFEDYAKREIGIRKQTALKLLRSYYFLEQNEPDYLKKKYKADTNEQVPEYESIDLLRLAKKKKELNLNDYSNLRDKVLRQIETPTEIRKELTSIIKERDSRLPEEIRAERRLNNIKRLLTLLKSIREEILASKMLPEKTVGLVDKVVDELSEQI